MRYISCDSISWRYESAPHGAKCLLLSKAFTLIIGPPVGEYGQEYIAWSPMPKRDKEAEREKGFL